MDVLERFSFQIIQSLITQIGLNIIWIDRLRTMFFFPAQQIAQGYRYMYHFIRYYYANLSLQTFKCDYFKSSWKIHWIKIKPYYMYILYDYIHTLKIINVKKICISDFSFAVVKIRSWRWPTTGTSCTHRVQSLATLTVWYMYIIHLIFCFCLILFIYLFIRYDTCTLFIYWLIDFLFIYLLIYFFLYLFIYLFKV